MTSKIKFIPMNEEQSKQTMREDVLKAIETGHVKMRSKWQYNAKSTFIIFGMVLIALLVLFLVSFIVFVLRQTGLWFVPGFGFSGFGIFFMSLPWVLILLAAIFMLLLEILVKRYSFAYVRPFLYSALAVIFLGIVGGILIGQTPLQERFFDEAENGQLPFAGTLYKYYGQQSSNITLGIITKINSNGYQIALYGDGDDSFAVIVGPKAQTLPPYSLKVGDVVVILGPRKGNTIVAQGIQKPSNLPLPRRRVVVPAIEQ
jgi:hypothetical protein